MSIDVAIAGALAREVLKMDDERRAKLEERLYGREAIALELGIDVKTLMRWITKHGLPLDKDPKGYSILRWRLDRWKVSRREYLDLKRRKRFP